VSGPDELAELIARYATSDGVHATPLPRVHVVRLSRPSDPVHMMHQPALCVIAQGSKQIVAGPKVYRYDSSRYLVVSVDVPATGRVLEATPQRPYLSLRLDLDLVVLNALMLESAPVALARDTVPGIMVSTLSAELRDGAIRLLRLLATPRDIPVLAPLAEREILYRLLMGEQGRTVRQIALADGNGHGVSRAIEWIKRNYREQFRIQALAGVAAMSPSALYAHFKTVTAMSPLQYQKQLRLQEARQLMLGGLMDAATAAYEVGYESPSQFSREYRRLFGNPPARDIARLKDVPAVAVGTPPAI
jgi:AraC-like DNA-binding protein